MSSINQITPEQIDRLTDVPFTELLLRLLQMEALQNGLPISGVSVPLKITVPDGGKDGEIKWDNSINKTEWLPTNNICFQVKATSMGAEACKKEVLKDGRLKEQVKKCFDEGGAYILFLKQTINDEGKKDERIAKIREAIQEAGETYSDTAKIDVYDGNKITNWVNQYPSVVSFVCEQLGLSQALPLKTFDRWRRNEGDFFANQFITSERVENYCSQIREIASDSGKTLRITGLSGLGKSRMIFQAFAKEAGSSIKNQLLISSLLYYDASNASSGFVDHIANLCRRKVKCNLIIDNCSLRLHNDLKKELRDTGFNLITTDSDPSAQNQLSKDEIQIVAVPEDFTNIIPDILKNLFSAIDKAEIERIASFAQGFPLIAVLLAKQLSRGSPNLGELTEESIIEKLLGIDSNDNETKYILRAVSLFEYLGYNDDVIEQRNFVATNKLLTPLNISDSETAKSRFKEVCEHYIKRGIIEVKGRHIFLKPKPLALRLAREWWESSQEDRIEEILIAVSDNGLATQLCDQIAKLDFVPKAKELTEKLCGATGPFGQAEVLNTEQGSRLFRSLVEVNPEATANCLTRIFSSYSVEKLKAVDKGRRNLVWALEKLCFREEIFERAAQVMLAFSAGENENWGNNATAQFLQLFHVYWPGTEANFAQRLKVIEFAFTRSESEYHELAIKAIERGFKTHSFSRMGGAEKQGSTTRLVDYQPNWNDMVSYWTALKELLIKNVLNVEKYHIKGKEILANNIFNLSIPRAISIILPDIKAMIDREGTNWPDALSALKRTLKHEKINLTDKEQKEVKELIEILEPSDIVAQYKNIIDEPSWEDFDRADGGFSEQMKLRTEKFAKEFFDQAKTIQDYIPLFYEGQQQGGFNFGRTIGEQISVKQKKELFIDASLDHFRKMSLDKINLAVLVGFLHACSPQLIEKTLGALETDSHLAPLSFLIGSRVEINNQRLNKLFDIVKNNTELNVSVFQHFRFSRALDNLPINDVISFVERLTSHGKDGIWTALYIIESYCYNNEDRWNSLKSTTKRILLDKGILKVEKVSFRIDAHSWEGLVKKIIADNTDKEFVKHIANEVVNFCDTRHYNYGMDVYVKNVIIALMDSSFKEVWPIIGKAILAEKEKYLIFFHFQHLIGSRFGFEEGILFQHGNQDAIFEWTKNNQPLASKRIANIMPTLNLKEGDAWHPFAKKFIDAFGNDKEVLRELTANLGSYSWTGSSVPLYEARKQAFQELSEHPIQNVRVWAQNQIEYCDKRIKEERIADEERYLL